MRERGREEEGGEGWSGEGGREREKERGGGRENTSPTFTLVNRTSFSTHESSIL